jgi:hypothetical protein
VNGGVGLVHVTQILIEIVVDKKDENNQTNCIIFKKKKKKKMTHLNCIKFVNVILKNQ